MGIYTSSKGIKNDTADMPIEYLTRALQKAIQNGDNANITVLQEEINKRNGGQNS
jgi:hypothetical protein